MATCAGVEGVSESWMLRPASPRLPFVGQVYLWLRRAYLWLVGALLLTVGIRLQRLLFQLQVLEGHRECLGEYFVPQLAHLLSAA